MNSKILNTIVNAIDNKEELNKRIEGGKLALQELLSCVKNCQNRFGGKSELATEDDIRVISLCEKWEKVLSHGIKTNLSNSAIQSLVTAGLNFTFNIVNAGNSLWSYSCLHLTKHEKERFKILSNINTPIGYFRAFLRAALNERSLERYLHSWIGHGLIIEYYEEGALLRDNEASHLLPNMAAGLSSILFALSIDRPVLNESLQTNQISRAEHVIPLPTPIKTTGNLKRKPLRQVISFDKNEPNIIDCKIKNLKSNNEMHDALWNSAPATCLNSPDTVLVPQSASCSEPATSESRGSIRHFFPDSVKGIDSPSQILTKLSECAKEMFSSSTSIDNNNIPRDDISEFSINNLKISESDSEEIAGSINGSTSCLELCFTEDEPLTDEKVIHSVLEIREKEFLSLQVKFNQMEIASKDKIKKLEKVVLDLSKENDRLKEQIKQYVSAIDMTKNLKDGNANTEEISLYEKKLVQVAEMHAELMEFNQHLQRRIQELDSDRSLELLECPESNVKVHIPAAFLVGKKTHSYHVYQIFLKIGAEEWNVYHRYAKFRSLHEQLKKCYPDIANYKFPPKKTLGKRDSQLVAARRAALQAYLRHVLLVLPGLRSCTNRSELITRLPFFGTSSTSKDVNKQQSGDSILTYDGL